MQEIRYLGSPMDFSYTIFDKVIGQRLDSMILEVFSNLNDSMIL